MDNVRILLLPIDTFDRRRHAEMWENTRMTAAEVKGITDKGGSVFPLTEFMDLCNDQVQLDLEKFWVSYITLV